PLTSGAQPQRSQPPSLDRTISTSPGRTSFAVTIPVRALFTPRQHSTNRSLPACDISSALSPPSTSDTSPVALCFNQSFASPIGTEIASSVDGGQTVTRSIHSCELLPSRSARQTISTSP